MVKAFCHVLSAGMKYGSITLNHRPKGSQWNGINQHFLEENFEATPAAGRVMATVFFLGGGGGGRKGVFGGKRPRGHPQLSGGEI